MAVPIAGDVLPRPGPDRHRHRPAQGQRQRHRRPALRAGRHAPRRRLLDLLHGDQPRRVHRAAGLRLPRPARRAGTSASRAAGVGMVLGARPVRAGPQASRRRRVCTRRRRIAGRRPRELRRRALIWRRRRCVAASSSFGVGIVHRRRSPITATQIADAAGYFLLLADRRLLRLAVPRRRLDAAPSAAGSYVIGVLFLGAALFWSVFEQAGSTLNLFADRSTRNVGARLELPEQLVPVAQLRCSSSCFAPVFAWLWVRLGRRGSEPSSPTKFGVGLVLVGAGFAVLIVGGRAGGERRRRSARCG